LDQFFDTPSKLSSFDLPFCCDSDCGQPVQRSSLDKEIPRLLPVGRKRSIASGRGNSPPANFKRNIQPDGQTVSSLEKFSIPRDGPGPAAKGSDPRTLVKSMLQCPGLDFTKSDFTLLCDQFRWRPGIKLRNLFIEI
jgi:hypothetical protein